MAGLSVGGSKNKSKSSSTTTNPYAEQQYNSAVSTLGNKSYSPLSGDQINSYMNPFGSSVIDASLGRSNQNRDMALNADNDAAIRAGAFDTTGRSVERALTRGQYDLNDQQTISGLNAANYGQALQAAQGENTAQNQYPLAIQQLLGQLAQGTKQNSTGKGTSMGLNAGWSAS